MQSDVDRKQPVVSSNTISAVSGSVVTFEISFALLQYRSFDLSQKVEILQQQSHVS